MPDGLQAGGKYSVVTPYRSPVSQVLDHVLITGALKHLGVDGPPAAPAASSAFPALAGAPTSSNPRDPIGALADIIATANQVQAGADQGGPQLAGAPTPAGNIGPLGRILSGARTALLGGGPSAGAGPAAPTQQTPFGPLPAMPTPPKIGLLEGVGDLLLGGAPTAFRRFNYESDLARYNNVLKGYQNNMALREAQLRMGALTGALGGGGQADQGGVPQDGGAAGTPALPNYSAGRREALANLATLDGHPDQANTILSRKAAKGTDGWIIDENTGTPLYRLPDHSVQNGYNVDLGAPGAPSFIPKLPDGTMPDGQGGAISIPGVVAAEAARARANADAANASEASYAGRKAFGTAAGTGAGSALSEVISVPDGRGGSTQMTRAQYLAALGGRGAGGTGPLTAGRLGYTPNPADQEFDKNQATAASSELNADMDARPGALQDLDAAHQALSYVQAHKMDQASPHIAAGAAYLRTLPPSVLSAIGVNPKKIDQAANDPAVYQRLSSQNLLSFSKSNLPSRYTEREMAVAGRVIPQLSTPNDAAAMHWGLQAAIANKALQRAQFAAGYQGPKTRQGIEQSWMTSPGGRASLFEDPVWKGVNLGGKPAVVYVKKGGKTYGVVGVGTGSPTSFLASGQ